MDSEELERNAAAQRAFFDELAPNWRESGAPEDIDIKLLLSFIPLEGRVLDVACGTGILDGALLSMGLIVDGVDISEKMIEKARRNNPNANYIVGDFYTFPEDTKYDRILVFDSYPHFPDKRMFAQKAHSLLKCGGQLWIFFDQSKESINGRHSGCGANVSVGLESAEKEAEAFSPLFDTVFLLESDQSYYIGLRKK